MNSQEQESAHDLFKKALLAARNEPLSHDPSPDTTIAFEEEEDREHYKSTLKVSVIKDLKQDGDSALLEKMYDLYKAVFPLDGEREELDKLIDLLQKNQDSGTPETSAPFSEQWVIVEDSKKKHVLAAGNFITFSTVKDTECQKYVDGTVHGMYIFVEPRVRYMGLAEFTAIKMEKAARKFIASTFDEVRDPQSLDIVLFAEQNAPLKMSPEAFLQDTEGAKMDQFVRRELFEKADFRELEFKYTQLPLKPREEGGKAEKRLDLIALGLPKAGGFSKVTRVLENLHPEIVQFHLYNFFHRSVAAGSYNIEEDDDWKQQQDALDQLSIVNMKPRQNFMALKQPTWDSIKEYIESSKFDNQAFREKPISLFIGNTEIPPS